jgi:hypothetical protein
MSCGLLYMIRTHGVLDLMAFGMSSEASRSPASGLNLSESDRERRRSNAMRHHETPQPSDKAILPERDPQGDLSKDGTGSRR